MNHLILEPRLLRRVLGEGSKHSESVHPLLQRARQRGYKPWIVAATLPGLLLGLRKGREGTDRDQGGSISPETREKVERLLESVGILSSYAFEANGLLDEADPERALVLRSADTLGDNTLILSEDQDFIREEPRALSPEALEKALAAEPEVESLPFIDLKAQQARLLPAIEQNVRTVLAHGQYILGPEIKKLEEELAAYVGVRHAVTCSSGTDALLMALMAYGVGPGDAIFTTPFTFIATAEVISLLGAVPVYVDIDPRTFNLDVEHLRRAVHAVAAGKGSGEYPLPNTPCTEAQTGLRPKGIIAVDLFGLPAAYDEIKVVAEEHGLFVIEDAAQSFGADYHGAKACGLADVGCTSFFPAKPLGCYGDGGAVFTDDDERADRMLSVRVHGQGVDKYNNVRVGLNARMDTLQAAVLLPKLQAFPHERDAREHVASQYTERLRGLPGLITPHVPQGCRSAWAQYSLLSEDRPTIQEALKQKGVPSVIYYPKPLHLQTAYSHLGYREGDFPATELSSHRIFSLPMHPYLQEGQIERVVNVIENVLAGKRA